MSDPTNSQPTPAGWYDDGSGNQRYWDGQQWTEHTGSAQASPAVPLIAAEATATSKPHVLAWIALGVAVLGFIFACIPGALVVGWILLPIAFILAIVAFFLKGKKWPAVAALVTSVVGTIVGVVVFFTVVAVSFNDAFGGTESTVTQPSDTSQDEAEDEPISENAATEVGSRENPAPLGSAINGDEYDVVINSVTLNANDAVLAANQFNEPPAEGSSYAIVNATITYKGEESGFAAMVGIDYVSSTGEVINGLETLAVAPEPALGIQEMFAGGQAVGNTVLMIPTGDSGVLRVRPGMLADDVFVALQ